MQEFKLSHLRDSLQWLTSSSHGFKQVCPCRVSRFFICVSSRFSGDIWKTITRERQDRPKTLIISKCAIFNKLQTWMPLPLKVHSALMIRSYTLVRPSEKTRRTLFSIQEKLSPLTSNKIILCTLEKHKSTKYL